MPTESSIVARICANLKRRGIWFEKSIGNAYSRRGRPDLMVIIKGFAFFLEIKRPGGKPTPLQEHRLAQLRAAGAVAAVVTSWEETAQLLNL